jgi:hypothetical protein
MAGARWAGTHCSSRWPWYRSRWGLARIPPSTVSWMRWLFRALPVRNPGELVIRRAKQAPLAGVNIDGRVGPEPGATWASEDFPWPFYERLRHEKSREHTIVMHTKTQDASVLERKQNLRLARALRRALRFRSRYGDSVGRHPRSDIRNFRRTGGDGYGLRRERHRCESNVPIDATKTRDVSDQNR